MSINSAYEKREELLILAQQQGYNVSAIQLARWHRAGLLPRPTQQPRTETRGTYSLYPPGTGAQLLVLCSLHEHERRLSHLAWQLWLMGYRVAPQTMRMQIQTAALRLSHWMQWFATFKLAFYENSTSEQALDIIERYAAGPLSFQPLRRIRKRIGYAHFPTFLCLLIELAAKTDNEIIHCYDEHEQLLNLHILARGLGLEKYFVQKKISLEYYLMQIFLPQLRWLFAQLQEVRWEHLLQHISDFELLQTRDNLSTWLLRWEIAGQYRDQLPADYPRWDVNVQEIFRSLPTNEQMLVFVIWLALNMQ
jgi:hypothetical protein